jgi:Fe-S-cluster-containing dehydrogenase component
LVEVAEQKILVFDKRVCTGCRLCELACSFKNFKNIYSYEKTHIRHIIEYDRGEIECQYCQHCEEPLCMASCPANAIHKDEETGIVRINIMECIGCQTCNIVCPTRIPKFYPDMKVSMKCNLCDGDPECVKYCSPMAISYVTREEADRLLEEIYGEKGKVG